MFEKSLVDLIRGLRNHKGTESEYIQSALKECRSEIRSQDMDVKATALLKLIYLEMFGYDMTWAAFNVLEVMSSAKQMQKRVGYLAAVQTFRPETEVLMLATNLLKKDLSSPTIPVMTLPLITLPHIITSSLALSILTDMLPRLSHSQPSVRKKTIVSLYRLALVYPETLRVAWPKIKDRLFDEQENSSVTAATVNVVCELGWRRPQEFLSLAPRLFELLIDGGNNWMAIKIIKLFAVLTPLEPRLVKKLVRPLTNLIQSTSAMSLLYECINGIIQGGILSGTDGGVEQDDVANLCIKKLREMILVDQDPNLKYVALLAFNKIAASYPVLVSFQEDVILGCLDDPDISIRLQALELACGIVSSDNLQSVVNRLLRQLSRNPQHNDSIEDAQQEEVTDMEQKLVADKRGSEAPPLPEDYRREVIKRILDMCSKDHYQNIGDFEWYLDVLVRLVRLLPTDDDNDSNSESQTALQEKSSTVASQIGYQLLDIAVRVRELRSETTRAAESLVIISNRSALFSTTAGGRSDVLKSAAWIAGEFPSYLSSPNETLNSLIHESSASLSSQALAVYVQAIPKIFAYIATRAGQNWDPAAKTTLSLLLARTINFLENLAIHPSLEVQERSVEYLEVLRLASEAVSTQNTDDESAPVLITTAIPSLFSDGELNPVAVEAQRKVPLPDDIHLDEPINPDLQNILQSSQTVDAEDPDYHQFQAFYNKREALAATAPLTNTPSALRANRPSAVEDEHEPLSYQSAPESPATLARRKAERRARNRDDPYYIPNSADDDFHDILSKENGDGTDLDLDSIPIINLQLEHGDLPNQKPKTKKKKLKKFVIADDETIDSPSPEGPSQSSASGTTTPKPSTSNLPSRHRNILSVDSSSLHAFALDGPDPLEVQRREAEEAEMAAALREVERLRLEMQRQAEQAVMAEGVDEGAVVKRKKKKSKKDDGAVEGQEAEEAVVRKKKKKRRVVTTTEQRGNDAQREEEEGLEQI